MMFEKLFGKKKIVYLVHVIYKSGATFDIWMYDFKITRSEQNGTIVEYENAFVNSRFPVYMGVDDISAVYVKNVKKITVGGYFNGYKEIKEAYFK